jgi:hypothetical protein
MSLMQYYTATSLDGFIADEEHSLDWLISRDQDRAGPLTYADFVAEVGAVAMGSTTYEWILEHDRRGQEPRRVEVALRRPVLGLHAPATRGGAGGDHVHERRRGRRARGRARAPRTRAALGQQTSEIGFAQPWGLGSQKAGKTA